MNYKQQLELAKINNINVIDLQVAFEVEEQAELNDIDLNDKEFECVCSIIENAYLKQFGNGNIDIYNFTRAYFELRKNNINDIDRYTLTNKACEFI